jgi:hypothetical protein
MSKGTLRSARLLAAPTSNLADGGRRDQGRAPVAAPGPSAAMPAIDKDETAWIMSRQPRLIGTAPGSQVLAGDGGHPRRPGSGTREQWPGAIESAVMNEMNR